MVLYIFSRTLFPPFKLTLTQKAAYFDNDPSINAIFSRSQYNQEPKEKKGIYIEHFIKTIV